MQNARDDGRARPNTIPQNGRRGLLIGAAAALAAAPFTAHAANIRAVGTLARDTGPDAEVVRLADAVMANAAEIDRLGAAEDALPCPKRGGLHGEAYPPAGERFVGDAHPAGADRGRRPWTGFRAKARVVQEYNDCDPGYADPDADDAMAWSLANDLTRRGVRLARRRRGRGPSMSARKPLPPTETVNAMVRLRQIAAEARDHLLLADGPPHPDADLLDLCAEAIHYLGHAQKALDARRVREWQDGTEDERKARYAEDERLLKVYLESDRAGKPAMARIAKMKATTAAGIFAKAMVVRCSKTGAAGLAMTLAEDLIACPGLRAALWPAGRETDA